MQWIRTPRLDGIMKLSWPSAYVAVPARSRTGERGRRGFALDSAVARKWCVTWPLQHLIHASRLEIVVDGLPLFGGAQL